MYCSIVRFKTHSAIIPLLSINVVGYWWFEFNPYSHIVCPYYQSNFQNLKTLTNELRDQRHKRKLNFLLSIPAFSQLERSVMKAEIPFHFRSIGADCLFMVLVVVWTVG